MLFTFIFGWLELQRRYCEIPFPKTIVYTGVELDKQGRSYKSFFLGENAESWTLKVADGNFHWQILKLSRLFKYSKLCELEIESCLLKKNFKENMKIIGWPYEVPLKTLAQLAIQVYGWQTSHSMTIKKKQN